MTRPIVLAFFGVVALTTGAIAVIFLQTRPLPAGSPGAASAAAGGALPEVAPPGPATFAPQPLPTNAATFDRSTRAVVAAPIPPPPDEAPAAAPVMNAAPAIDGPPVVGVPENTDAAGREEAAADVRRQRFGTAMDQLNRRNAARFGLPSPPAVPATPPPSAPASRRAAAFSGAEPAPIKPAERPVRPPPE
ncbi:MAG TPA: hypothetical protein VML50_16810 [Anaeromyxobacter sp.]|nr:hypothetical protein [Anaeromyxobacter sp.]